MLAFQDFFLCSPLSFYDPLSYANINQLDLLLFFSFRELTQH